MKQSFVEGLIVTTIMGGLLYVCINDINPSDVNRYVSNKYESAKKSTVEYINDVVSRKEDMEKDLGYSIGMPKTTKSVRNLLDKYADLDEETATATSNSKETPSDKETKEEVIEEKYVDGELFERYAYKKYNNMYIQLSKIYSIIDNSELYKDERKLTRKEVKQIKKSYKKFKKDYDEMLKIDYPVQDELYKKSLKSYTNGLCEQIENVISNYKDIDGKHLDNFQDKLNDSMAVTEHAFYEYNIGID